MEDTASTRQKAAVADAATAAVAGKQAWQEPAIVLERSLEAAAQDPTPGGRRAPRVRGDGFLGPLGLSVSIGGDCF